MDVERRLMDEQKECHLLNFVVCVPRTPKDHEKTWNGYFQTFARIFSCFNYDSVV